MNLMRMKSALIVGMVLCWTSLSTAANLQLSCPNFFSNDMVLQRNMPVPVWGWGKPGTEVQVSFAGQNKSAKVDKNGYWKVILDKLETSSENQEIKIVSGDESISFKNVLVGEVWLASGQSNMQWGLRSSSMPKEELEKLNKPMIRIITVSRAISASPLDNLQGTWQVLNSKSAPNSSAVACYFAMKLQEELNIPIGIISSSWGGTRIEPWTPAEGFELVPELKKQAEEVRAMCPSPEKIKEVEGAYIVAVKAWLVKAEQDVASGRTPQPIPQSKRPRIGNRTPGAIYNAMIHPLLGFAMRGAIWYQGESNMGEGLLYEKKMQALVGGWRKVWKQGDFPFYFVQLAPFGRYSGPKLGGIWEAQMNACRSIKNAGMAVTTDIGNLGNIHPKNKKDVGGRLARWALVKDYGKDMVYSGPLYNGYEIQDDSIVISFDYAENGLSFKGKEITDVYIKGEGDKNFVKANPTIDGSKLVVKHPEGKKPLHVRMGWNKSAQPNLTNKEGLPASPFRTDK